MARKTIITVKPFRLRVAADIETSHLICMSQMTCSDMKCKDGLTIFKKKHNSQQCLVNMNEELEKYG